MARKFDKEYRVRQRDRMGERFFNSRFLSIDKRLHALETIGKSWKDAVDEITRRGLKRIDAFLAPAIESVENLAELGFLQVRVATGSAVVWSTGEQAITIRTDTPQDRTRVEHFHPAPFVVLTRESTHTDYLIAKRKNWQIDRDEAGDIVSATLTLEVLTVHGSPSGGQVNGDDLWVFATPGVQEAIHLRLDEATAARDAAQAAETDAENAGDTAVSARNTTETYRDNAQSARNASQSARDTAQTYRDEAETARDDAHTYRDEAQDAVGGVRVTNNDTQAQPLDNSISVLAGLTKSVQTPGSNEALGLGLDLAAADGRRKLAAAVHPFNTLHKSEFLLTPTLGSAAPEDRRVSVFRKTSASQVNSSFSQYSGGAIADWEREAFTPSYGVTVPPTKSTFDEYNYSMGQYVFSSGAGGIQWRANSDGLLAFHLSPSGDERMNRPAIQSANHGVVDLYNEGHTRSDHYYSFIWTGPRRLVLVGGASIYDGSSAYDFYLDIIQLSFDASMNVTVDLNPGPSMVGPDTTSKATFPGVNEALVAEVRKGPNTIGVIGWNDNFYNSPGSKDATQLTADVNFDTNGDVTGISSYNSPIQHTFPWEGRPHQWFAGEEVTLFNDDNGDTKVLHAGSSYFTHVETTSNYCDFVALKNGEFVIIERSGGNSDELHIRYYALDNTLNASATVILDKQYYRPAAIRHAQGDDTMAIILTAPGNNQEDRNIAYVLGTVDASSGTLNVTGQLLSFNENIAYNNRNSRLIAASWPSSEYVVFHGYEKNYSKNYHYTTSKEIKGLRYAKKDDSNDFTDADSGLWVEDTTNGAAFEVLSDNLWNGRVVGIPDTLTSDIPSSDALVVRIHNAVESSHDDDVSVAVGEAPRQISTGMWASITGASASTSGTCYLAFSWDGRSSYIVWNGSGQRKIASSKAGDHGGTDGDWYYQDGADMWQSAGDQLDAIKQAMQVGANQVAPSVYEGLAEADWSTFGFQQDIDGTLDLAVGVSDGTFNYIRFTVREYAKWVHATQDFEFALGDPAYVEVQRVSGDGGDHYVIVEG